MIKDNWAISLDDGAFRPPQTHSSNAHTQPSSGASCLIFGQTLLAFVYFHTSCVRTAKALADCVDAQAARAFAGRLCDKYHNLMSWFNFPYFSIQFCWATTTSFYAELWKIIPELSSKTHLICFSVPSKEQRKFCFNETSLRRHPNTLLSIHINMMGKLLSMFVQCLWTAI